MTPRMKAAWEQMQAFEKKYHMDSTPSQCMPMVLDLVQFYPDRRDYVLACDEFYKASREYVGTVDSRCAQD